MALSRELLLWLDAETVRYWTVAWLTFFASTGLAWFSGTTEHAKRTFPWFILMVPLTLAAFRWPSWFYPLDLNPDEAQIVAGALTLERFPIMWKHLDTTTHGPLCELALVAVSWAGAPFNYVTARIMAVLLQAVTLLAIWRTIRVFADEQLARLAILPGLAFWSFVSWDDFIHYSSELPGLCLLALGTWSATRGFAADLGRHKRQAAFFIAGLCLGAVPLGKLQSAPQALATAALVGGLCWFFIKADRVKLIWLLSIGLGTPGLVVVAYVLLYGQTTQFWFTYVQSAIDFLDMAPNRLSAMPGRFLRFSAISPAFAWFFWGNLGFALLYFRGNNHRGPLRVAILAAWGLVTVAFFCVLRPARETAHYLHLLIAPLTTLTGFTLARACPETDQTSSQIRRWYPLLAFVALTLMPQIYDRVVSWNRFAGYTWEYLTRAPSSAACMCSPVTA